MKVRENDYESNHKLHKKTFYGKSFGGVSVFFFVGITFWLFYNYITEVGVFLGGVVQIYLGGI